MDIIFAADDGGGCGGLSKGAARRRRRCRKIWLIEFELELTSF